MTRQEAEAIYDVGKETVVRVLLDLSARVDQLTADFAVLKAGNMALRDRVQTLEEQVAKNSHNSHKPPSSDGLAKPKPKSLRPKSERPTGGQPGHPGHTLRMVEKPDRIVSHRVERCSVPQGLRTDRPGRLRAESGCYASRPETQRPPQAEQGAQPARPLPRPPRQRPRIHARLRGALRQ